MESRVAAEGRPGETPPGASPEARNPPATPPSCAESAEKADLVAPFTRNPHLVGDEGSLAGGRRRGSTDSGPPNVCHGDVSLDMHASASKRSSSRRRALCQEKRPPDTLCQEKRPPGTRACKAKGILGPCYAPRPAARRARGSATWGRGARPPRAARGGGITSPYYAPAVRNAVPLAPRPAKALRRHARPSRKGHNRGLLGRLFPCVPGGRFSRRTRQRVNAILFTAAHAGGPCTASAARATVLKIVQNVFVLWGKHTNVCR